MFSSDHALFEKGLNEMKEILCSNGYSPKFVDTKIKTFLENDKKPPRENLHHTITLNYNSHRVQKVISSLIKKMKNFVPNFAVNTSFRSVKITKFFSSRAKPRKDMLETTNCVYQFKCPCNSSYIGMTERTLLTRLTEHYAPKEEGIFDHFVHCNVYKTREKQYLKDCKKTMPTTTTDDTLKVFRSEQNNLI